MTLLRLSVLALSTALSLLPGAAGAYVGLGPGMTMIGSFFSLVAALVVILLMVLLLPLRIMLRRRRAKKDAARSDSAQD